MEHLADLPINLLDAGVIILIFGSAIFAYARGFVHEICSIAGWAGAILATIYGFHYAQPYARNLIEMTILADLAAGTLIFLFALVVLSVSTRKISRRIRDSALNALDRALGFLFGLLRGALIIIVIYIGLDFITPQKRQPEWVRNARVIQFAKPAANFLIAQLPDDYAIKRNRDQKSSNGSKIERDSGFIVRKLISPEPNKPKQPQRDGYGAEERQDMDRLIRNTEPK